MATENNSATGTKTVAELKEAFATKADINFAKAEEVLRRWHDPNKTYTKTTSIFNKETLRTYLQNIGANEKNIRNLSWYLYYRSQIYNRLIQFFSNMFDLNARSVIPPYDMVKGGDAQKMLKSFQDTVNVLDNMHLQGEFYNVYVNCFIQDVFYGVVFYDDTGIFIYNFPADYARSAGKYMTGDFGYEVDCSYFKKYPELLEYFPEPFGTIYKQYEKDGIRWQEMPQEYALCLKYRAEDIETIIPPFLPIFNAIINLADLEDIQAVADAQAIYKLIWMELETIQGSKNVDDWKNDPAIVSQYFNKMINDSLPDYISAALVPGKLNEISFPEDQSVDTSKVAKATETVLNTAGGAEILNGATINNTYAFKMATIANTEYAISSLLPQTQGFVNRFLETQMSNPSKVKFFPISVYTREDYKEQMLTGAQNGLPTKLAYNTLNGFSEKETMALNFFEEEVLGLKDKLVPLSTSYTQSNDGYTDEVGQGAPEKDPGDLTDSGERSRNQ